MQLDFLPEEVPVSNLMEDLRTEVAKTVFRVHHSTFEEAVDIALDDEFNFKRLTAVRMGMPRTR